MTAKEFRRRHDDLVNKTDTEIRRVVWGVCLGTCIAWTGFLVALLMRVI